MDDTAMKFGLLMESAQAHQKLAETHLDKLRAHTQNLDGVVRDEIRRTLVDELQVLTGETARAAQALRRIGRSAALRSGLWSVGIALLCSGVPIAIARWALPNAAEISALRVRRDELVSSIAELEKRGGRVDLRRCGDAEHLCVRVDRKSPTYGEKGDYYVVQGY